MSHRQAPRTPAEMAETLVNGVIKAAIKVNTNPSDLSTINNMLIALNGLVSNMSVPNPVKDAALVKELIHNPNNLEAVQSALTEAQKNGKGVAAFLNKIPAFLDTLGKLEMQQAHNAAVRGASVSSPKVDIHTITKAIISYRSDQSASNMRALSTALANASDKVHGIGTNLRNDISIALQDFIKSNPGDRDILNKAYESELLGKPPSFIAKAANTGSMDELYAIDASAMPVTPKAPAPVKNTTAMLFSRSEQGFQAAPVAPKGTETTAQRLAKDADAPKTEPAPRAAKDVKAARRRETINLEEGQKLNLDSGGNDTPKNRGPGR